jgi:hypothetical protein
MAFTAWVPYALWARRRLQGSGAWQPLTGRDLAWSLLALPPLLAGAQLTARRLTGHTRITRFVNAFTSLIRR